MPAPLGFPTGAPVWMDLNSRDVDASIAFYEEVFGWESHRQGAEFGGYVNFSLGGKMIAGLIGNPDAETVTDFWTVYLETDDVETTAEAVRGAGGSVYSGPHVVGELGSMLIAGDADGAVVGAWQRGRHRGFEVLAEPGAPAWFELHTTQFADSVTFYQQAFGWQTASMSDTPDFHYEQLMVDGAPYAGVMDATAYWPAGASAQWMVYVNVADADSTVAKAVELGGREVDAPVDTPFGRMGALADSTGALIKVIE